jgi:hypothetical protein
MRKTPKTRIQQIVNAKFEITSQVVFHWGEIEAEGDSVVDTAEGAMMNVNNNGWDVFE